MQPCPTQREPEYLHGAQPSEQERLEALAKMLGGADFLPPLSAGMRILDLGCGTGAIAREVASRIAPGQVVGVDRQEAQVRVARELAAEHSVSNVDYVHGEAGNLDLEDGGFDGVYCRFVLEHVASPLAVVREMARVVKPGGWVCALEWENGCAVDHPESPAIDAVWHALYRLQADLGSDPWIARKLYGVFREAALADIRADGRVWTVTAGQPEKLQLYVDGALEIIRQGRDGLLARQYVTAETLNQAQAEYQRLLECRNTFSMHGFCCAVGTKARG